MPILRMRRRKFIFATAGVAAWPVVARAQRVPPVIGIVSITTREAALQTPWYRAFNEGLREHGWEPGKNLFIEHRFAENDPRKLVPLVRELVRLDLRAIFVPTRPALRVVKEATTTIPIVFVSLGDPVAEGWVTNLARPNGNLTGVAGLSPELAGKRLQLLRELVPSLKKIAVLWNPSNSPEEVAVKAIEISARNLGMSSPVVQRVLSREKLRDAITSIVQAGGKSIVVLPDPMFFENRVEIVGLINQAGIPAIYMETGFVAAGGLISYGPKFTELFRLAATYVDKILKGAKPGELPIEQPTNFELVINLKTATALGVAVPTSILFRADQIIE